MDLDLLWASIVFAIVLRIADKCIGLWMLYAYSCKWLFTCQSCTNTDHCNFPITYICHNRFTENIVYFITIHYWKSKRVTGNRQWRITCQAGMLLKKQCHQTICIWHKYIFTCIILQVNRRLFFQSHHWNTDKKSPFQSVCIFFQVIELSIIWLQ